MNEKPSKYATTQHNHFCRVRDRLVDTFSQARSYSWTNAELVEQLKKNVWESQERGKLSLYYRGMLSGMEAVLHSHLYQRPAGENSVVWQLYLDGQRIGHQEVPEGRWKDVKGIHEWSNTGKPFGMPDEEE